MEVCYGKANTLTLSYVDEVNGGKVVKMFKFVPGRNKIDKDVWEKIKANIVAQKDGETKLAHYLKHLTGEEMEVTDEGGIDYASLNASDLIKVIADTMELDELEVIEALEIERDPPRKTVADAIDKQRNEIEAFREDVEAGKKD